MDDKIKNLANDLLELVKFVSANAEKTDANVEMLIESVNKNVSWIYRQEGLNEMILGDDLIHVSTQNYNNAGDVILSKILKLLIKKGFEREVEWADVFVSSTFDTIEAKASNRNKAIVVGGGGLFFDSGIEQESSWKWAITHDAIEKINVPVFLFAVGYNQFRGQGAMKENFKDDILLLAKKCEFIGLRNHGSVESIKKYLPEKYHEKLVFQPCPTTMISRLVDCLQVDQSEIIAFNMAFDKSELRYGSDDYRNEILVKTLNVVERLSSYYKIQYIAHMKSDEYFATLMKERNIKFELIRMYNMTDEFKMIDVYRKAKLVVGMRGHSQMVPFGCGVPIVSIVSHNKMQWFLEDIGHKEWGVDVWDSDYENKLETTINEALENYVEIKREISSIQDEFWDISMDNIKLMKKIID